MSSEYVAGVCNIGGAEIKQRRRMGRLGLVISLVSVLVYYLAVVLFSLEPLYGLLLSLPFFMAAIGLIQARQKFCAAYGLGSRYNVSESLGTPVSVEEQAQRSEDRKKAVKIILQSAGTAIVLTAVLTLLGIFASGFSA